MKEGTVNKGNKKRRQEKTIMNKSSFIEKTTQQRDKIKKALKTLEPAPTAVGASELFFGLKEDGASGYTNANFIIQELEKRGLRSDDPRLKDLFLKLRFCGAGQISQEEFSKALSKSRALVDRAMTGKLIIPHFQDFTQIIASIFHEVKHIKEGVVANYIPQLKKVDPDKFGISVCTVDGQKFSLGDCEEHFSIQSCSKTFQLSFGFRRAWRRCSSSSYRS